jgi:hypothetical protein
MTKSESERRLNLTLTRELEDRLNNYVLEVHKKLGRLPYGVRTKLGRMALEEWFERHGNDFDIDWDSRE